MSASLIRKLQQAEQRLRAGDSPGAQSLCEQVLRTAPRNPQALCLLGVAHLSMGRAAEAVSPLERALRNEPRNGVVLDHLGLALLMLGRFTEAEKVLAGAVRLPGAPAAVFMRLGVAILEQGRAVESLAALRRAVELEPENTDAHLNLGRALAGTGDTTAAREHFQRAMELAPQRADAAFNLGVVAMHQEQLEQARLWFERALAQAPGSVDVLINLGIVLQKQSQLDEAVRCLRTAVALEPTNVAARTGLGQTLAMQGETEQAREQYLAALQIAPDAIAAHEGLAAVCVTLGRMREAIPHLRAVTAAEPDNASVLNMLARASYEVGQLEDAGAAVRRALELNLGDAAAHATLANLNIVQGELEQAIGVLESGYEATKAGALLGMLAYQLRQACDWPRWRTAWDNLAPRIATDENLGSPFWLLCEPTTAEQQLAYTRRWAATRFKEIKPLAGVDQTALDSHRLRIGYLSSDLHEHATAYLIAEVLELHDRDRFEIFAYSYGPEDHSPMRERLRAACEHFVDIAWQPDDVAARRIRDDRLDLLVDLKGYTVGDRLTIMARRPCAIQATWLGYPGTTGATCIDYLIADEFVIPPGAESAYSERIVRLPHCYQPNDRKRAVAETLSRPAYQLPEQAFVFCCFNQTYKITAEVFAVWMRLLGSVPDSVLWLFESNALAKRNLLARARDSGLRPERLIFAPRLPNAQHLARYRAADLALDTFPYTSHTTLSDALWCGCPAVALCGDTFAARVSGSLLTAAGLSGLVTHTLADYEALAMRLAQNRQALDESRARIAQARDASALFDSAAFTRALEDLYTNVVDRHRSQ